MKTLKANKETVRASALIALQNGVSTKTVKHQLQEHDINVGNVSTRSQLIVHLNKQ